MAWFEAAVRRRLLERPNLDVLADALAEWFQSEDYRGCAFINVVAEAGGGAGMTPSGRARGGSQAVARRIRGERGPRAEAARPQAVAEEAMVCIEGMIVRYQMVPDVASIDAGRRLLARLHAAG